MVTQKKSNASPSAEKPEIHYPCVWQYTVIGRDRQELERAILEICAPVPVSISFSHASSSGKYLSLNAEIEIQDEEARLSLFNALYNHPAIKIVL